MDFKSRKEQDEPILCHILYWHPQNATQIKQPGKIVAFEELGGFENIGEERVVANSHLWKRPRQIPVCGKDLGKFEFIEMIVGT